MKTLYSLILTVFLASSFSGVYSQNAYDQAVGRKWLGGGDVILRTPESFTFTLNKGVKYSIVIEASSSVTISLRGVQVTADLKEFSLEGEGEAVTLWITPTSKKASVTIGFYYVGKSESSK